MKKFLAFIFAFVTAALLCVAPALSQPAPQDEVAWFKPAWLVGDIVLSPDGTKLYNSVFDSTQYVIEERNSSNGEILRTIVPDNPEKNQKILDLEISNDGKYLAAIFDPTSTTSFAPISVFNLITGEERHIKPTGDSIPPYEGFTDITISPDSKTILALKRSDYTYNYAYIAAFDIESSNMIFYKSNTHPEKWTYSIYSIEYCPDGNHFVVPGGYIYENLQHQIAEDRELLIWDAHTYQIVDSIKNDFNPGLIVQGPPADYQTLKFSAASGLMGFGHDNMINFYNYHTWDTITTIFFNNNLKILYNFDFSNTGQQIVSCRYEKTTPYWLGIETMDINTKQKLYTYDTIYANQVIVSYDDNFLYIRNQYGVYKLNAYWQPSGLPPTIQPKEFMEIYPNPALNEVKIEINFQKPESCTISLTDLSGKLVQKIFEGTIDGNKILNFVTEQIPNGIYYITLTTKQNVITKQFVRIN